MQLRLIILLATLICFVSCQQDKQQVNQETEYKIPGSFHSLQLLTKGRAFPNPDIPKAAYGTAFDYHKAEFLDRVNLRDDREWEAMGPLNTTGRTLTMAFNPQNPKTIYAGSASGGLWRSYSGGDGLSWEYVETGHPILGVSTIAFEPNDSTVMYIGTGEVYNINRTGDDGAYRATRGSYGFGILKSEDGGVTWEKSLDWTYNQQEGIWMIKVSPSDPNIVTAATTDGTYRSIDSGESWSQIHAVQMATDVEVDPNDPNRIIVACGNLGSEGKGIYYTNDGGQSWARSPIDQFKSFQGKIQLAMSNQDANVLYASVGNGFSSQQGYTWLCKTEDFGETWQVVNQTDYSRWQGWFSHDIAIHPISDDIIIAVGIDIHRSTNGGLDLFQQSEGGVTLGVPIAGLADGPPYYSHSDHHFALYHPTDPSIVYYANDGGIFKSEDGGTTFQSKNGGMQTAQFYHGFVVSPLNENFAMGGLQDNSTSIFEGNGNWRRAIGGDGSWSAVDPDDSSIAYGSWQNLNVRKTTNMGLNFFPMFSSSSNDTPLFIAPFAVAPSNGNVIYAAGQNIYKSENEGSFFEIVWPGATTGGDPIFSVEIAPSDADIAYFGFSPEDNLTQIIRTLDGGLTFDVSQTNLPNRIVNDLSIDANDPSIVYAVFSGFGSDHVFKSTDAGITWFSIDANLPDVPTNCIQVDPNDSNHLYVGTDIAVYFSENGGESWDVIETGIPMAVIAMDFAISPIDNKLWIATHGNGTYRTDLASMPVSNTANANTSQISVYPNPASSLITIKSDSQVDQYQLFSLDGKLVRSGNVESNTIQVLNLQGIYNLTLQLKDGSVWNERLVVK